MPAGNFILKQYQWALECVQDVLLGLSGGPRYIFGKDLLSLPALGRALDRHKCCRLRNSRKDWRTALRVLWAWKGGAWYRQPTCDVSTEQGTLRLLKLKISWVRTCQK